jgi:predicted alpha/beta superfamily hydrolase
LAIESSGFTRLKIMKTTITCLALAVVQLSGYSQPVKETPTPAAPAAAPAVVPAAGQPAGPPYQLAGTETFELFSPETGNTYNIVVGVPSDYAGAPAGKTYPVIYVIDAQWQFPLIYVVAGAVNYDGAMPPALLVGISWKTTNGNLMTLRDQDMTPAASKSQPGYGQAEKFQDFLRHTLIPRIESHYRASQHRTLTGCSTSSLFVFYTMLSQPDLFEGYIASSPPLSWDNYAMNSLLDKFPPDGFKQNTRAYMTCGALENSPIWADFASQVARKNLKNLSFTFTPVSNSGHAGENAECYTRGLQFVFATNAPPKSGPESQ